MPKLHGERLLSQVIAWSALVKALSDYRVGWLPVSIREFAGEGRLACDVQAVICHLNAGGWVVTRFVVFTFWLVVDVAMDCLGGAAFQTLSSPV